MRVMDLSGGDRLDAGSAYSLFPRHAIMAEYGCCTGRLNEQGKQHDAKCNGLDGPPVFEACWQGQGKGKCHGTSQTSPEQDDLTGAINGLNRCDPVKQRYTGNDACRTCNQYSGVAE